MSRKPHRDGNVWYTAPWHLTRWWWFGCGRGGDEWHNLSVYIILPFIGEFTFFWKADRSGPEHDFYATGKQFTGYMDPDCNVCAEILGWLLIEEAAEASVERWLDETYRRGYQHARLTMPGETILWLGLPRLVVASHAVRKNLTPNQDLMSIWFEGDKQETILPFDHQLTTLRLK